MAEQGETIAGVLKAWEDEVQDGSSDIGSILRAAGNRTAGPLLFLPALVMVSPLGAIPGIHIGLATIIVLVAGQVVIGARAIWMPSFLRNRKIPRDKVISAIDRLLPYARQADKVFGRRLAILTGPAMARIVAGLCILLAVLVYPATLVPVVPVLPGGAIVFLSLGLLTKDGLVTLLGLLLTVPALGVLLYIAF